MDTKDLIKHSIAKDASNFKKTFGELVHNLVTSKIDAIKSTVAKSAFNEETGDKEEYKKFFNAKLDKYGVSSPSELSDEDKKKFYDEIDAEWEGDNEED